MLIKIISQIFYQHFFLYLCSIKGHHIVAKQCRTQKYERLLSRYPIFKQSD